MSDCNTLELVDASPSLSLADGVESVSLASTTVTLALDQTPENISLEQPTITLELAAEHSVGSGVDQLFDAACSASEAVGDPVYHTGSVSGGLAVVALSDRTDPAKLPAVGIVEVKPTSTTCKVRNDGPTTSIYTGLTPGSHYFVSDAAGVSTVIPASGTGEFVQHLGTALTSTELLVKVGQRWRRSN